MMELEKTALIIAKEETSEHLRRVEYVFRDSGT
jgi:hypothetical protein